MEFFMRGVIDLGMRMAKGEGCIVNIKGAYFLLNYAKKYLSGDERETYEDLKDVVGNSFGRELPCAGSASRLSTNRGFLCLSTKFSLENPERDVRDKFEELLDQAGKENFAAVYKELEKLMKKFGPDSSTDGSGAGKKKDPKAVLFGNYVGIILHRFDMGTPVFYHKIMDYLTVNNKKSPCSMKSWPVLINNYLNGVYYPQKEKREVIAEVLSYIDGYRSTKVFRDPKGMSVDDFDLEPYTFFQKVFIDSRMTAEEIERLFGQSEESRE